jgi:hypothetical protein
VHIGSVLSSDIDGIVSGPERLTRELPIAIRIDEAAGFDSAWFAAPAEEPVAVDSRVLRRRDRLARGLASIGIGIGRQDSVMVLCCQKHQEDLQVAVMALGTLGAVPVVPVLWSDPISVQRLSEAYGTRTYIACEEGVEVWRAAGVRGRMVGNSSGAGVLWWKALETRHASLSGDAVMPSADESTSQSLLVPVRSAAS